MMAVIRSSPLVSSEVSGSIHMHMRIDGHVALHVHDSAHARNFCPWEPHSVHIRYPVVSTRELIRQRATLKCWGRGRGNLANQIRPS